MKQIIDSVKKLVKVTIVTGAIWLGSSVSSEGALLSGSLTNGTNVIRTSRVSAYQIDITSATANVINIYDCATQSLNYVVGSYTGSSNYTMNVTNIYTNAVFVTTTSTNMLLMTNIFIGASWRTNFTVPQTTNMYPSQIAIFVPAGQTATFSGVDLNFVNGITMTATNSATYAVYTRP